MFKIIRLEDIQRDKYNEFIEQFKCFDAFYSLEWLECLENCENNIEIFILLYENCQKNILSIMPFSLRKKYGIVICESMFAGTYGGMLTHDENLTIDGLRFLKYEFMKKNKAFQIRIFDYYSTQIDNKTLSEFSEYNVEEYIAATIDLEDGYNKIYDAYKHNIRKNIKKAIREDVNIKEIKNIRELKEFYKMAQYTYNLHKTVLPYSYTLYENIFHIMCSKNLAKFHIATKNDIPIAGSIHFFSKEEVFNWLTPSYREYQLYRGNTLLIDQIIKMSCDKGLTTYNLGASPKDSNGLLSFKHSWGADDRMYNYINYTNDLLKTILNAKRIFYNLVR